jgi:hypothetical protein
MKTPYLTRFDKEACHATVNCDGQVFCERMIASANGCARSPGLIDFSIVTDEDSSFPPLNERA